MNQSATARLRIAMISYYLPSGSKIGVGHQVHALANHMTLRGHDVTVFSSCGASEDALYRTVAIPLSGANRTFKFALRLRKVDWTTFDVLHAHGDNYWLWRRRAPVHVRTVHGSCFSEAIRICGARERLRMVLLGLSELLGTVVADEAVAVSKNTRRWMPWVKIVIPNGVDLSRFYPGEKSPHPSVLFVGTYRRRKRGKLLVEAFQRDVLPRLPNAELWMVADDAHDLPGVTIFGQLSADDLADLYRRAWVFCLPSTYEGFGIPYIEAMASGCPVVATPNAGALEATDCGRYGLLVHQDELGMALLKLLTFGAKRRELAQAALERAVRYDLAGVADAYERLYGQVITQRRAAQTRGRALTSHSFR